MSISDADIEKTLRVVTNSLYQPTPPWRLAGSVNLYVQDVPVSVNNINITTTRTGVDYFTNQLLMWNEQTQDTEIGLESQFIIGGIEVLVAGYNSSKLDFFSVIQETEYKNMQLPTLSLLNAKQVYDTLGNQQKVAAIQDYIQSQA